ncbi:MAG: AzlD domain-containing protein [Solirubrobacteraceae bacterium]
MSGELWALVAGCAVVTALIKAAGPVALGGRELPERVAVVIALTAPALLAALVVTQALADGDRIAIGADTAGVGLAGVVLWRGGSVPSAVAVAVLATAGLRALG